MFFVVKDGEALYNQQKQDLELTVAQIMGFLLPKFRLKLKKVEKTTRSFRYVLCLVAQSCMTLCNCRGCSPPGSSVHGDSPGKSTGVGCLLQGIFPTQGLNPGLPHCRRILYRLSHQGSPRILEWSTCPFSRGSSRLRKSNQGFMHCRGIL